MDKMLYVIAHLTDAHLADAILELLDAGVITADYAEVARQLCFVSPKIAKELNGCHWPEPAGHLVVY